MRGLGTIINTATVLVGGSVGYFIGHRIKDSIRTIVVQVIGLATLVMGISNVMDTQNLVFPLVGMVLGAIIGELLRIEDRLESLGEVLRKRFAKGSGDESTVVQGFVTATLLFCVGPMTLLGAIQNGLTGDASLLFLKATLDGLSAIALTSSFGVGVGFSVLVILLYQGGVALLAGTLSQALPDPAQDPRVLLVTGVGGLMILGIGINLLGLTRVRVASFLPALLLAPLVWALADRLG